MVVCVVLGKIKNDFGFIECIFVVKIVCELFQEEVMVFDSKFLDSGVVILDFFLEEIKKMDVVEQIISEVEEKVFKENVQWILLILFIIY